MYVLFWMSWVFHFIVMAVIGYSHLVYRSFLSIYLDCKVFLLRCSIAEGPLAEKSQRQAMNIVVRFDWIGFA